ncbi:M24 family metallopeptidase [Desulfosarcina ovata]|uniref:M24 family metallopeptidase n=1 Tax=Desulfosarcina ovata TaxID=83564 RepID=UPI0039C9B10F
MTDRTYFFKSPSPELKRAYDVAYEFMEVFKENAKQNTVRIGDVVRKAADVVTKNGLADNFMGCPPNSSFRLSGKPKLFRV